MLQYTVFICDVPTSDQLVPLFRDSSNCRVARLSSAQRSDPNVSNVEDRNARFEAIACDPANGKIYVGNEENPMLIWSLDINTRAYSVLIDAERLPEWTSRIVHISGMTYDPIGQMLYVASSDSKVVIQSTLNGTLIGSPLDISMMNDPQGLSYDPTSGDLIVFGEPREIAIFGEMTPNEPSGKSFLIY